MRTCSECRAWRYDSFTERNYGMGVGVCAHYGQQRFCDHQCPFCFPKDGDDDAYN